MVGDEVKMGVYDDEVLIIPLVERIAQLDKNKFVGLKEGDEEKGEDLVGNYKLPMEKNWRVIDEKNKIIEELRNENRKLRKENYLLKRELYFLGSN